MMTSVNGFFSKHFVHEKEISGDDIPCIHVSCGGGYRGSGKSCSRVVN